MAVHTKIWRHYASTWLAIDFLSTFPVDTVVSAIMGGDSGGGNGLKLGTLKLFRTLRLIRLLKLVRLLKLGKMMPKLEDMLGVTPAGLRMIKLFVEVSFIAHFLCCGWYVHANTGV